MACNPKCIGRQISLNAGFKEFLLNKPQAGDTLANESGRQWRVTRILAVVDASTPVMVELIDMHHAFAGRWDMTFVMNMQEYRDFCERERVTRSSLH